ncbi:MAG: HPP family protein [Nitrospirae bacterium]|nr:MAG: HPP family protein [Nitrospirota bacterium]
MRPSEFFAKMRPTTTCPPRVSLAEIFWSWVGAFLGIAAVAFANYRLLAGTDYVMVIGSFGASAVLIYGAIKSPLAQPRNLVGGHVVSGVIGVACYQLLHPWMWVACAVAVATAIAVMHALRCLHPPGGATALIAVIGSGKIHALGYLYALVPAGLGALVMLFVAVTVNNLAPTRRYPEYWW